jgi:glutathione S-transferase
VQQSKKPASLRAIGPQSGAPLGGVFVEPSVQAPLGQEDVNHADRQHARNAGGKPCAVAIVQDAADAAARCFALALVTGPQTRVHGLQEATSCSGIDSTMLLYVDRHCASPYAMSAFVALEEKGLAFQTTRVDLERSEHRSRRYADESLTQRVPTLVHDSFALSESSAIAEYLDESFAGTPLYPSAPKSRARARQLQAWLRSDLLAIRHERSTEVVFYGRKAKPLSKQALGEADKLFSVASALLSPMGDHLFGAWSIADVDLALMLNRLALHGDEMPEHLIGYAQRQWVRPSVQRWVCQERPELP